MDAPLAVAGIAVFLVALFFFIVASRNRQGPTGARVPPPVPPQAVQPEPSVLALDDGELWMTDDAFDRMFDEAMGNTVERRFHSTITGTSHRNDDGTSRTAAIKKCQPFTPLAFVYDEGNAFSQHAMMVCDLEGRQLGWLPDRTGEEVLRAKQKGTEVVGCFRHWNRHPETGRVVGGIIVVVYLKSGIA